MKLLSLSALLLINVLTHFNAYALNDDIKQEAQISANNQSIDLANNVAIYKGNVKITQGSIEIIAEFLKVYNHGRRGDEVMVFSGEPAQFSQTMDDKSRISAKAKNIRFERATNLMKLSNDVSVSWGDNVVTGDSIHYDINKRILNADGNQKNDEQVTTILQPKSNDK